MCKNNPQAGAPFSADRSVDKRAAKTYNRGHSRWGRGRKFCSVSRNTSAAVSVVQWASPAARRTGGTHRRLPAPAAQRRQWRQSFWNRSYPAAKNYSAGWMAIPRFSRSFYDQGDNHGVNCHYLLLVLLYAMVLVQSFTPFDFVSSATHLVTRV